MTEQDPTGLPERRPGRHAAPRIPARIRLRGRALAMAAVPTALLMAAAYAPTTAVADPAADKCASAPDAVPTVAETPVPKSELPAPVPTAGATTAPTAPSAPAAPSTAPGAPTAPTAPSAPPVPTAPSVPPVPTATSTPTQAPVANALPAVGGSTTQTTQTGLIGDLLGGITNLFAPAGTPSATATVVPQATATAAPAAVAPAQPAAPAPAATQATTQAPAPAPSPQATGTASPKPTAKPSGSAKPSAGATGSAKPSASGKATASPSASASPTADPNCQVDISGLRAANAGDNPILVPDQNWTLQTSRLALFGSQFHGVVDVRTPTGTKRVLKFVAANIDIDNLDMSTLEGNGKTFHVKGAPGSTSTMRRGPVTMYVERLSGHLSKIIGLPIPIDLGEITLTPDTLPQWLYDLIGSVPIPLDLELKGVTVLQAGQFGGTLKIPGMRLYNDDVPYVGNAKATPATPAVKR